MSIEQHLESLNATVLRLAVALEHRNLLDEHPRAAPTGLIVGDFPLPETKEAPVVKAKGPAPVAKKSTAPKAEEAQPDNTAKGQFLAKVGHTSGDSKAVTEVFLAGLTLIKTKQVTAAAGGTDYQVQLDKVKAIGRKILTKTGVETVTKVTPELAPAFLNELAAQVQANA